MITPESHLSEKVFAPDIETKSTRDGFGTGTVAAGKENKNVVVLSADLKESTRAEEFQNVFPDRFIEMGVAEQNMATVAAGLASVGKIPFITSYAAFSPGRNYEQIRTTIALNDVPVVVCGMHAGVSVGPDGATHQMLEDIGMMRMLPNMIVLNPSDAVEAHKATLAAAEAGKPVYLRFGRSNVPVFTTPNTPFSIGKAQVLWESENPQLTLIGTGSLSYDALLVARALDAEGIGSIVIHVPTIKPLDEETILGAVRRTRKVITLEEHQTTGGLGSAITELLGEKYPVPVRRLGIQNRFGQSGTPAELFAEYGIDVPHIIEAAHQLIHV